MDIHLICKQKKIAGIKSNDVTFGPSSPIPKSFFTFNIAKSSHPYFPLLMFPVLSYSIQQLNT